ncbi:MAG TPA: hypothetical protein VMB51_00860 [Solirubrobacteraceae bacterium]|nr:hypothetical protein [Solirubrobacteraceae bacterium]
MRELCGLENVSLAHARSGQPARVLTRPALACGAAVAALAIAGCGGGSQQNAGEPSGVFPVRITHASFPALQSVARPAALVLTVNNAGTQTIPNVAVSLNSLYYETSFPGVASKKRPIWVLERGPGTIPKHPVESEAVAPPGGGQTAYVETWALGPLAPGASATFHWLVTPVEPGLHHVRYVVAAGLAGNAKARFPSGAIPRGGFLVHVAPRPPARHVNPETGKVTPGPYVPSS